MKRIHLSGYVGDEINSYEVKRMLDEAKGDAIEVHLNTVGGSVREGIAIYDLFDKYDGEKSLMMGGLVASIGSYIATAFPKVTAQDITVYMIHNAHDYIYGDQHVLETEAKNLGKLSAHIADRLARFTGKKVEDVAKLMDEETWLYGKDILDAGFATDYHETGKAATGASNVLDIEKLKYHERLKSVAVFRGGTLPKEEEEIMDIKEFMEKAKGFIQSGEFKFENAVELFGAKDQLITEKQRETLNALGDDDPKVLREKAEAAEKAALASQLTDAFGAEGVLRSYAEGCVDRGMKIEDIQKDPVAMALAAKRADGATQIIDSPAGDDTKDADDGDTIVVSY